MVVKQPAPSAVTSGQDQHAVNTYFDAQSAYWNDLYTDVRGVVGEIIRDRQAVALRYVDGLSLPAGSRILEIGCGAGWMAIEMARRGFHVAAIDASPAMVDRTTRNATAAGVGDALSVAHGDTKHLNFDDGAFDLVVAIGVIPWIEQPVKAVREMSRVAKPGGHLLMTSANRNELRNLLDPWRFPPLRPLKLRLKKAIERTHVIAPSPSMTFPRLREVDAALAASGLTKTRATTVGFGPYSIFGLKVIPEPLGANIHRRLQRSADRGNLILRNTGMSYVVLSIKGTDAGAVSSPASSGSNILELSALARTKGNRS